MIVKNNETQELGIIDIKNLENQEEIYKLIKEQKFNNTNKKTPKKINLLKKVYFLIFYYLWNLIAMLNLF